MSATNRDESRDDIGTVRGAIDWQARYCDEAGAPIAARLVRALLQVMKTDTACARRLSGWAGRPLDDSLALRVLAGLHHLRLTGTAPRLEPVFAGFVSEQSDVDALVSEAVEQFDTLVLPWFDRPPQTNEAARSATIMAALMWLAQRAAPKFDLTEIGASAGINTMMGRFHFDLGGVKVGPSLSSIAIAPGWRGAAPPAGPVEIVGAKGCDLSPVNLADPAQALRLKAYVWPDATDRMLRLDKAIASVIRAAPDLVQMDAAPFVEQRLAEPQSDGVTRVLFHTIVWQYLSDHARGEIEAMMGDAGAQATAERPLAWVRLETNCQTFRHELEVRCWPGPENWITLAEAHPHGEWVEWLGD